MTNVSPDTHRRVLEVTQRCIDLANKRYGMSLGMPRIEYSLRGCTAGKAMEDFRMLLHPHFLVTETEDMINVTVPHEIAHIIVGAREHLGHYGNQLRVVRRGRRLRRVIAPHGPEWGEVMELFGLDPERCHKYDVKEVRVRKARYQYQCANPKCNRVISISGRAHNQLLRKPNSRWHIGCKGHLLIQVGKVPAQRNGVPVTSNTKLKAPNPDSKLGQAYALFKSWKHLYDRQGMMAVFTQEIYPLTNACASTYYYQCQKLYEAGI